MVKEDKSDFSGDFFHWFASRGSGCSIGSKVPDRDEDGCLFFCGKVEQLVTE